MPSSPASEGRAADAPPQQAPDEAPERDLAAELERMEDRYKRALADLDNYRKRSARELERLVADRRDALLLEWLEVVDGLERALRSQPEGPLVAGLRAVLEQTEGILARQGVRRIGEVGERFDPARHEAVGVREAGDAPDMTVADVVRSGFAMGDRVLRPAEVIVARAQPAEA